MLVIQTDLYVASGKVIPSVSLKATDFIYRFSGNCRTAFQILQKLLQFPVLIDPVAILISGNRNVISVGGAKGTGNIDRIIICSQLFYISLYGSFVQADLVSLDPDPGFYDRAVQNLSYRAKGVGYRCTAIF